MKYTRATLNWAHHHGWYLICLIFLFVFGCTAEDSQMTKIPDTVKTMNNIAVYSYDEIVKADTVRLVKDRIFGDTDEVYIGRIVGVNVDKNGRVYVNDGAVEARTIHVYEPDGTYIKKLGRYGNGPGEFLAPAGLRFNSEKLFVFDYNQSRLSSYSINSLNLIDTYSFDPTTIDGAEKISDTRFSEYHFIDEDSLIVGFKRPQKYFEETSGTYHYFTTDINFSELGKEILTQDAILESWGEFGSMRIMKMFPFFEKPLLHVSGTGRIFGADSGDFFIKEYSGNGKVKGGFYYQVARKTVMRDDAFASSDDMTRDIAREVDLPESWPVIRSMFTDDKESLWVSTFSENDDKVIWWIIDPTGELIARFRLDGNRYSEPNISVNNKQVVRNNYFYQIEKDEKTGAEQVVRYRIEI